MKKKTKKWVWGIVALLSILYVSNLGAGVLELIPDMIPIVGNADEAAFGALLYNALVQVMRK
jgi:hypothetical protein